MNQSPVNRLILSNGLIRKVEVKTTVPNPRTSLDKNLKTVHRVKAVNHLIPLKLKVEVNEHSINPSLDANLSQNMEHPIPNAQAPDGIYTDATWNLENPHPTDICQRLEFNFLPDTGGPCGLPDCRRPRYHTVQPLPGNNHTCAHSVLLVNPLTGVTTRH